MSGFPASTTNGTLLGSDFSRAARSLIHIYRESTDSENEMRCLIVVLALLPPLNADAADVYLLQGSADTPIDGCQFYGWRGAVLLHNGSSSEATVTLLGFGNLQPLPGVARE